MMQLEPAGCQQQQRLGAEAICALLANLCCWEQRASGGGGGGGSGWGGAGMAAAVRARCMDELQAAGAVPLACRLLGAAGEAQQGLRQACVRLLALVCGEGRFKDAVLSAARAAPELKYAIVGGACAGGDPGEEQPAAAGSVTAVSAFLAL
jgi:hypothetical protein